tara:strand:+ start:74 stop:553 length:480 start_codon:yes stop_codon:yes gene_type:complete
MRNKIATWGLIIVSCANPNLESNLELLRQEIASLEISVSIIDIPDLVEQVEQLESALNNLVIVSEGTAVSMNELREMITTLQEGLNNLEQQFSTLAPNGTLQELLVKLQKIHEGIDTLVARADYDFDGVINALDECPDTPITEINNVNEVGCSPSQLNG